MGARGRRMGPPPPNMAPEAGGSPPPPPPTDAPSCGGRDTPPMPKRRTALRRAPPPPSNLLPLLGGGARADLLCFTLVMFLCVNACCVSGRDSASGPPSPLSLVPTRHATHLAVFCTRRIKSDTAWASSTTSAPTSVCRLPSLAEPDEPLSFIIDEFDPIVGWLRPDAATCFGWEEEGGLLHKGALDLPRQYCNPAVNHIGSEAHWGSLGSIRSKPGPPPARGR